MLLDAMTQIGLYDVVEVPGKADAAAFGVSGTRGVILGISAGENETQFDRPYR
jgi:hypothetical protein